jgi:hypothetical protein
MSTKKRGIQLKSGGADSGVSENFGGAFQVPFVLHPKDAARSPSEIAALYDLARELRRELEETLEILKEAVTEGAGSVASAVAETGDREA